MDPTPVADTRGANPPPAASSGVQRRWGLLTYGRHAPRLGPESLPEWCPDSAAGTGGPPRCAKSTSPAQAIGGRQVHRVPLREAQPAAREPGHSRARQARRSEVREGACQEPFARAARCHRKGSGPSTVATLNQLRHRCWSSFARSNLVSPRSSQPSTSCTALANRTFETYGSDLPASSFFAPTAFISNALSIER